MTHGGHAFHQARRSKGLSPETVAHHTGLSVRTIARYETYTDWGRIPYGTVLQLARLVELDPNDLIAGSVAA